LYGSAAGAVRVSRAAKALRWRDFMGNKKAADHPGEIGSFRWYYALSRGLPELLLGSFTSLQPAADASAEMLHVGVAQLLSLVSGPGVSAAGRTAAISNDECALVSRELGSEVVLGLSKVDGAGNVAVLEGGATVHVDDGDGFGFDSLLQLSDADIWIVSSEDGDGASDEHGAESCDDFLHGL